MSRFLPMFALLALAACGEPYDKAGHVVLGAAVGHAVTNYTDDPMLGLIAATGVGLAKEAFDYVTPGDANVPDAAFTAAGGLIGVSMTF